jgi:hypothetical protein
MNTTPWKKKWNLCGTFLISDAFRVLSVYVYSVTIFSACRYRPILLNTNVLCFVFYYTPFATPLVTNHNLPFHDLRYFIPDCEKIPVTFFQIISARSLMLFHQTTTDVTKVAQCLLFVQFFIIQLYFKKNFIFFTYLFS